MSLQLPGFAELADGDLPVTLAGVPDGFTGEVLARIAVVAHAAGRKGLVHGLSDGQGAALLETALRFHAPHVEVLMLPGWDCLPYDRVSPSAEVVARRIHAFARLQQPRHPIIRCWY